MSDTRFLALVSAGQPTTDGAGVKLTRMVGTPQCDMVDPFLMLDRFDSDDPDSYIAGFPDHPHRGFETVTIMLEGRMRHRDSVGNDGVLGPGDIQWMTAGRGIVHSEMPEMIAGRLKGFQLWVNLPAAQKMTAPAYQDIAAADIPTVRTAEGAVRVLAGAYGGETGPAQARIPIRLLDVCLAAACPWSIRPDDGNGLLMCVYEGAIAATDAQGRRREVAAPAVAVFEGTGAVEIEAGGGGAEILYCEGAPIAEKVARYGPFVMTTRQEIEQAIDDYNSGRFASG